MMHTRSIADHVLNIPELSVGHGVLRPPPRGQAPPPPPLLTPVSLKQLLATKNDLMRRLVKNDE
jgi:hypothetical protein